MATPSRGIRFMWLLGIVLLLGSAIGAGVILNQPAASSTPSTAPEPAMIGVVGLGYVDVEDGVSFLHPVQPGRVDCVWVQEGDQVREGDLLISLKNESQKSDLRSAEAALEAANVQLREAEETLVNKWKSDIRIQEQLLQTAREELKGLEAAWNLAKRSYGTGKNQPTEYIDQAAAQVEAKKAAIKAQEAQLDQINALTPQGKIDAAKADVKAREAARVKAHHAVIECDLYAPADGTILRLFATPGDILSSQPRQFAVQFCPDRPRIVRVEILQEWASLVREGMLAEIEDDTRATGKWKGKVERVSKWFSPRRVILQEPFQYNDTRTLECIVYLEPGSPLRIGQRVRVILKQERP